MTDNSHSINTLLSNNIKAFDQEDLVIVEKLQEKSNLLEKNLASILKDWLTKRTTEQSFMEFLATNRVFSKSILDELQDLIDAQIDVVDLSALVSKIVATCEEKNSPKTADAWIAQRSVVPINIIDIWKRMKNRLAKYLFKFHFQNPLQDLLPTTHPETPPLRSGGGGRGGGQGWRKR